MVGLVLEEIIGDHIIPETRPDMSPPWQYYVAEAVDDEENLHLPASEVIEAPLYEPDLNGSPPTSAQPLIMKFLSLPEHVRPA